MSCRSSEGESNLRPRWPRWPRWPIWESPLLSPVCNLFHSFYCVCFSIFSSYAPPCFKSSLMMMIMLDHLHTFEKGILCNIVSFFSRVTDCHTMNHLFSSKSFNPRTIADYSTRTCLICLTGTIDVFPTINYQLPTGIKLVNYQEDIIRLAASITQLQSLSDEEQGVWQLSIKSVHMQLFLFIFRDNRWTTI